MRPHADATVLQIAAFPVFIPAAFLAALLHDRWPSHGASRQLWIIAILVLTAGNWWLKGIAADVGASIIFECAMAMLNAAQRLAPNIGPPTTVMTGNSTQVAVSLARGWRPLEHSQEEAANRPVPIMLVVTSLIGCVLGALSA